MCCAWFYAAASEHESQTEEKAEGEESEKQEVEVIMLHLTDIYIQSSLFLC